LHLHRHVTDSIFEPIEPLFFNRFGQIDAYEEKEVIAKSKEIINDVQTFVNSSYTAYAKRYHNVDTHRWDIKQELIAKRALWVGKVGSRGIFEGVKKRYAQWIVDKEGHAVAEIDVKGLDVVRSDFPQGFRDFMSIILTSILHDATKEDLNEKVRNFREEMNTMPIEKLMMPTGVSLASYTTDKIGKRLKGTPVHVKSAMNYNDLLTVFNITSIPKIADGDKILWTYLKKNKYNFETIALKGYGDPPELVRFVEEHIDREALFQSALKPKLTNFWYSLGWGEIIMNNLINKFFSF
jgi:DNA polymerase elongation subunit (family B)